MVKKGDGSYRPCGDYRLLNQRTKPDRYPLPRMSDILSAVSNCKIFSTIDLEKAYHQIPIHEEDKHKTAIITQFGLYEYNFMPFGLKNASQTFQRYIDQILRPFRAFALSYIDDIIIFSPDQNSHKQNLAAVRTALQQNGLKINENKCKFHQHNVNFLGFNISGEGIQPIQDKIDQILNLKAPANGKALKRFIGAVTFYQWMIPHLSQIISPLHDLAASANNKRKLFNWTRKHLEAFETCKQSLLTITSMAVPNQEKIMVLYTDASTNAIGASLNQYNTSEKLEPIAFFRKLNGAEKKYSAFDRELLAVYLSIKHFKHHLEGTKFILRTDHKPILHIHSMKAQSNRQRR